MWVEEIGKAVRESNKQSDVATSRTLGKAGPRGPATNPSAFTGPGPNTLWQMLVSIDLVKALFCNLKKSVVCPFRGHYLPGFCHRSLKTKRTKKSELISVLAGRSLYSCYSCKETGAAHLPLFLLDVSDGVTVRAASRNSDGLLSRGQRRFLENDCCSSQKLRNCPSYLNPIRQWSLRKLIRNYFSPVLTCLSPVRFLVFEMSCLLKVSSESRTATPTPAPQVLRSWSTAAACPRTLPCGPSDLPTDGPLPGLATLPVLVFHSLPSEYNLRTIIQPIKIIQRCR